MKRILLLLSDYSPAIQVYLIIDAVDESNDEDRREILELLINLCLETKYCVIKAFIASRPVGVLQHYISKFHLIRLQDKIKSSLARFTDSFLKKLELSSFHE